MIPLQIGKIKLDEIIMLSGFIDDSILYPVKILISTFFKPCRESLLAYYSDFVILLFFL